MKIIWKLFWSNFTKVIVLLWGRFDVGDPRRWRRWFSWSWYYLQPTPNWFCSVYSYYWYKYEILLFVSFSPFVLVLLFVEEIEPWMVGRYVDESIIIVTMIYDEEDLHNQWRNYLTEESQQFEMMKMMLIWRWFGRDYYSCLMKLHTHFESFSFRWVSFISWFK